MLCQGGAGSLEPCLEAQGLCHLEPPWRSGRKLDLKHGGGMSQAEARNQDCVWLSQLDSRAQALGSQGSLTLCCCTKHISRELIRGRKAATLILDANIARNGLTISVFMVRILQKTFKHNDPLPSHSGKCRLPPRPFKIYSFV